MPACDRLLIGVRNTRRWSGWVLAGLLVLASSQASADRTPLRQPPPAAVVTPAKAAQGPWRCFVSKLKPAARATNAQLKRFGSALRQLTTKEGLRQAGSRIATTASHCKTWVKQNPGKVALICVGGGLMVATSIWAAPALCQAMGGGVVGKAVGGALASSARSLWVNGGMQLVQRPKVDVKELATDVALSALGGAYGFGLAKTMENGTAALGLTGLTKGVASLFGLGAIEATKDAYQIAIRNKINKRTDVTPLKGALRCLPLEILTNSIRIPAPTSFVLKTVSDVSGAAGYHMIVNHRPKESVGEVITRD